jgi:hypothetical protein
MDEQSPHESQPKIRRAKSGGAEEPQPSVTGAESAHQREASENVSEKPLHACEADEEVSRSTNKEICQVESVLPWPFQATQHALDEWTHFFGRAVQRNSRAAGDLSACPSVTNVLRWHRDLVQSNVEDWLQTSFSVFGVAVRKVPHAKAASETTAT